MNSINMNKFFTNNENKNKTMPQFMNVLQQPQPLPASSQAAAPLSITPAN
jgi:hypothetical protein